MNLLWFESKLTRIIISNDQLTATMSDNGRSTSILFRNISFIKPQGDKYDINDYHYLDDFMSAAKPHVSDYHKSICSIGEHIVQIIIEDVS
jgi:hypothetical protein